MSAGGWTQSASPFGGMTATDLAVQRNRTAFMNRLRVAVRAEGVSSARRNKRRDRTFSNPKGQTSMQKFSQMLGALRSSASEILAAGGTDTEARLMKSLDEFEAAFGDELAKVAPIPGEELDAVSLLADRLAGVHEAIALIEAGGCADLGRAPSDDAIFLAKGVAHLGNLALQYAASDMADFARSERDLSDGEVLLKIADAAGGEVLVKTALPDHAAPLVAHPEVVLDGLADFGLQFLDFLGFDLTKPLVKKAPPFVKKEKAARGEEGDEAEGDEEAEDGEGEEEDEGEEGPEGFAEGEEGDEEGDDLDALNPMERAARMASMALLEIANLKEQMGVGDGMDQAAGDDGTLSALDALGQHLTLAVLEADALAQAAGGSPMMGGAPEPDGDEGFGGAGDGDGDEGGGPANPAEQAEAEGDAGPGDDERLERGAKEPKGLKKARPAVDPEKEELKKQLADAQDQLKKAAAQPSVQNLPMRVVTKGADAASGPEAETDEVLAKRAADMAATDPNRAAAALIAANFRRGGVPVLG